MTPRNLLFLIVSLVFPAVAQQSEFAIGKAKYLDGNFKSAAAHFELALRNNSNDAECHYWLGRSYVTLADIATPFGSKYSQRARFHLSRALELEPRRNEFRRELFEFLVNSPDFAGSKERQAKSLIAAAEESGADDATLRARLEEARRETTSLSGRMQRLFQFAPETAARIAGALSSSASAH